MRITEPFILQILKEDFPDDYQEIYDGSLLLQYLDKKMKAVHGNSKTRREYPKVCVNLQTDVR